MKPRDLLILLGCLLLVSAAPPAVPLRDATGRPAGVSGAVILLFWAKWCAPCRAEVANYDALAQQAAPIPLIVIATDSSAQSRKLLSAVPADRLRFPANDAVDVMILLGDRARGLPAALAFNAKGELCGAHQGGVGVEQIQAWRKACSRNVS